MATCAELEQQASQKANELSRLTGQVNSAVSYNITSADIAEELGGEAATILIRINQALADLEKIQLEQVRQNCPRAGYLPEKRAARDALPKLNAFIDKADAIISKAREEQQKSQKATEKENNAGTGTPGTAGQGPGATPDADELEEVEVSSKKKPEPIDPLTEPIDSGPLELTEPTINTGDDLTVDDPNIPGQVDVDVTAPPDIAFDEEEENENTAAGVKKAQAQAVLKDTTNFEAKKDWRVRLSLSPGANYLYKSANPGILAPLKVTDGILFPYTPTISVSYNAQYDQTQLTHNNYKYYQYVGSNVDNINITCDFTAQDTFEANYLLAVIHFFRSATKMFYGQDENPKPGTPPPLCYLFGMGEFQFNAHPLAITNFAYSLPNTVDYIRAGDPVAAPGQNRSSPPIKAPEKPKDNVFDAILGAVSQSRLVQGIAKIGNAVGLELIPGGGIGSSSPTNNTGFNSLIPPGTNEPTYVPTSIQLSITCVPIVSRYDISNEFSLDKYASGELLRGIKRSGGGIW